MDNKRLFLALVLTIVILLGWSLLFPPPREPQRGPAVPAKPTPGAEGLTSPEAAARGPGLEAQEAPPEGAVIAADQASLLQVRSALYEVSLSNEGGEVHGWRLLKYLKGAPMPGSAPEAIDLVQAPEEGAPKDVWPLRVLSGDPAADEKLARARFVVEGEGGDIRDEESRTIRLRWADGRGSWIDKQLTFRADSYVVEVAVAGAIRGAGQGYVVLGGNLAGRREHEEGYFYAGRAAVLPEGGKITRQAGVGGAEKALKRYLDTAQWPPALENWLAVLERAGQVTRHRAVRWAGLEGNYFTGLAFADTLLPEVVTFPVIETLGKPGVLAVALPLTEEPLRFRMYVGPKDSEILKGVRADLVRVIDFGFFEFLAKLLLGVLRYFHGFVPNYGVCIILLTLVVQIVFLPLSVKQLSMMQRMTKLRPQLKQIEERYARQRNDPKQRLEANRKRQAEIMALYQKEGVNPASGCLPLLLQLPVLYGFYSLLGVAIELRHAPFVLWVQDLSAKDPLYVTPILMTISMIVMQAVTPTTADPTQRRLMYIMPVVFGWIFKDLGSGLGLYWLTRNVLSILQQGWMNRIMEKRDEVAKGDRKERKERKDRRAEKGAER